MKEDLVSVIMPTYNAGKFLADRKLRIFCARNTSFLLQKQ